MSWKRRQNMLCFYQITCTGTFTRIEFILSADYFISSYHSRLDEIYFVTLQSPVSLSCRGRLTGQICSCVTSCSKRNDLSTATISCSLWGSGTSKELRGIYPNMRSVEFFSFSNWIRLIEFISNISR